MSLPERVVLNSVTGDMDALESVVWNLVENGVQVVAVVGRNCALIEDLIDQILAGGASREAPGLVTTSHPGESLEQVLDFLRLLDSRFSGGVVVVEL